MTEVKDFPVEGETKTFENLGDALAAIDELEKHGQRSVTDYMSWVEQLTGHKPGKPVGPLDVVKIVQKAFRL